MWNNISGNVLKTSWKVTEVSYFDSNTEPYQHCIVEKDFIMKYYSWVSVIQSGQETGALRQVLPRDSLYRRVFVTAPIICSLRWQEVRYHIRSILLSTHVVGTWWMVTKTIRIIRANNRVAHTIRTNEKSVSFKKLIHLAFLVETIVQKFVTWHYANKLVVLLPRTW